MGNRDWLPEHRAGRPYFVESTDEGGADWDRAPIFSRMSTFPDDPLLSDRGFNNHDLNDGSHVSPFDEGRIDYGLDNLTVKLVQGVNEPSLKAVLSRALRATTGIHPAEPDSDEDSDEMFRGGLRAALETQVIVFEVYGASRALTHQLVRTRKAGFHQQSQRATFYGDKPNVRFPMSVLERSEDPDARVTGKPIDRLWQRALEAAWEAYSAACDAGISYQDARYILPEGTTNYILCEYSLREFIDVFAYRGCSMFLWEMVGCMREMRRVLLEAHPFLEPYVKISCENGALCPSCGGSGKFSYANPTRDGSSWVEGIVEGSDCPMCGGIGGDRKCTFQGWENVEGVCSFPWAKQSNRVFLPKPRYRIGENSQGLST